MAARPMKLWQLLRSTLRMFWYFMLWVHKVYRLGANCVYFKNFTFWQRTSPDFDPSQFEFGTSHRLLTHLKIFVAKSSFIWWACQRCRPYGLGDVFYQHPFTFHSVSQVPVWGVGTHIHTKKVSKRGFLAILSGVFVMQNCCRSDCWPCTVATSKYLGSMAPKS